MAILGAQVVITLVVISLMQKLGPHFSFARWLLCSTGLYRYLYPTDTELKQLANIPKDKTRNKKNYKNPNGKVSAETFHIPRNIDVRLETVKVTHLDVIHLRYYTEYQWLVDFSLYALLVYVITEICQLWISIQDEINLSMLWCTLVILFALKLLLSLTIQYFKGEESVGERSTCIVMGFSYLLLAMIILIVDENKLELGLESAYSDFKQNAADFLDRQGLSTEGLASKIVIKFFIALWCGLLGAIFTFPGMRIARMHWDLLKYYGENKLMQTLLNISFALPFLIIVLWVKPVAKFYLTVKLFSGRAQPLLSEEAFEILRIVVIILTMLLKLIQMPWYLQAYLDMAYQRTQEQKKEAGRITNVDFKKKIAGVFYYLCVVTLQYVAPVFICLFLTYMYKTLGEFNWSDLFKTTDNTFVNDAEITSGIKETDPFINSSEEMLGDTAAEIQSTVRTLKSVFTKEVYRGLLGFSTWWCCFLYFATTSMGLLYQTYFASS